MNEILSAPAEQFALMPNSPDPQVESILLAVVQEVSVMTGRRTGPPLVCVTFKQPLPEKSRVEQVCQRWKLHSSDLYRIYMRLALQALESPTGELRQMLEQHRKNEIEKDRLREESEKKRRAAFAV